MSKPAAKPRRLRVRLLDLSEQEVAQRLRENEIVSNKLAQHSIRIEALARLLSYDPESMMIWKQEPAIGTLLDELSAIRHTLIRSSDYIDRTIRPALYYRSSFSSVIASVCIPGEKGPVKLDNNQMILTRPAHIPTPPDEIGSLKDLSRKLKALHRYLEWFKDKAIKKDKKGKEIATRQIQILAMSLIYIFKRKGVENIPGLVADVLNLVLRRESTIDEQYIYKMQSRDRELHKTMEADAAWISDEAKKIEKKRRRRGEPLPKKLKKEILPPWPYGPDKS